MVNYKVHVYYIQKTMHLASVLQELWGLNMKNSVYRFLND